MWCYLKRVGYKTKPTSLEDVCHRIVQAYREITPEMHLNVHEHVEQKLYCCDLNILLIKTRLEFFSSIYFTDTLNNFHTKQKKCQHA